MTRPNGGVNNYFSHYFSHLGPATSLPTETIRALMTLCDAMFCIIYW